MNNPYLIDEPAAISFSGGRTSAYMLFKIIEAHNGLPEHLKITFANTGREMPQTLDFVQECSERWSVPIVWLECFARKGAETENKYVYETREVCHKTASRKGEPFISLIRARRYAPNPVARFCTQELKILRIRDYMNRHFDDWQNIIGIRADEVRRYHKSNSSKNRMPLYHAGATKETVSEFWKAQDFDLRLPNNNGTTDWGNCDLCFLKGLDKKLSIIRERPELADWWIQAETELAEITGKKSTFRSDQPDYEAMKIIATSQDSLFDYGDESISCFCGD